MSHSNIWWGAPTGVFRNAIVQNSSTGTLGLNNSGDTFTLYDLRFTAVNIYAYGSDGGDPNPMVKYSQATNVNGAIFSPGTKVEGSTFDGCSSSVKLKRAVHTWVPLKTSPLTERGCMVFEANLALL